MSNELALIDEQEEQRFFQIEAPRLKDNGLDLGHISYLHIYEIKKSVFKKLGLKQLEAQKVLLDIEKNDKASITELTEELSKYSKLYAEMKKFRITYTNWLEEKLKDPAVKFENEVDPKNNEIYKKLENKLNEKRFEQANKRKQEENKNREKQKYAAHIAVENAKIIEDYNLRCWNEIDNTYAELLKNKADKPNEQVIKDRIKTFKLKAAQKYVEKNGNLQYITPTEALEIYNQIKKEGKIPDLAKLQEEAIKHVDDKLKMYQVDLQNVKQNPIVIEEIKKEAEHQIEEYKKIVDTGIKIEETFASAEPIINLKAEGKQVKELLEVVDENTFEWDLKVMDAFRKLPNPRSYLRDRQDWGTLDIHAMASAIEKYSTETGDKNQLLQYKEVKK